MSVPPKELTQQNAPVKQEDSSVAASESKSNASSTNDLAVKPHVLFKPSPTLSSENTQDMKHPAKACPTSDESAKAAVPNDVFSSAFAPPSGHYYTPAPEVSLILQPLINTPGVTQLSALFGGERNSEYRHNGPTPRPIPTQSSTAVITNRTPAPFSTDLLRNTSTGRRSYSSTSVFRNPTNQDRLGNFSFGFTPMMHAAPNQQMPSPSPIFPLALHHTTAFGHAHLLKNATITTTTTPLHPFDRIKKDIVAAANANKSQSKPKAEKPKVSKPKVSKPKATKPKATKPKATKPKATRRAASSQQMAVSAVMTMEISTRACRCPKNQCIKLYCECFHRGQVCDPSECICKKCLNTKAESGTTGKRTKKVQELLSRKGPNAFKVKPKKTGVGCSCKKSRCLKKYCDCVTLGRFCDPEQCICKNCQNLSSELSVVNINKENVAPPNHDVKVFIDVTKGSKTTV